MENGDAMNLAIASFASVRRLGGVDDSSIWMSLSECPQLLLVGDLHYEEQAVMLFEVDILPIAGCGGQPFLCVDFGEGFDEAHRIPLDATSLSASMFSAAVVFSSRPMRIRIDPCAETGEFLCSEVRVSTTSRELLREAGEEPLHAQRSAVAVKGLAASPPPRPRGALRDRGRIGAILHLFYEDQWLEMSEYLARIPGLARLYVSIQKTASRDLEGQIAAQFPQAVVRRLPNRGRDVLPFLHWLELAAQEDIELVCKIHTKRSPHLPLGDACRRDMLDKLLGSESIIRDIISSFRVDPSLGIIGPGGHLVPSSFFWERNAVRVEALCLRMGFDVKGASFEFVAGAMFWARVEALLPLCRLHMGDDEFEEESGLVDGTTAHALERCFPVAALISGYRVAESANGAGTTMRDFAP